MDQEHPTKRAKTSQEDPPQEDPLYVIFSINCDSGEILPERCAYKLTGAPAKQAPTPRASIATFSPYTNKETAALSADRQYTLEDYKGCSTTGEGDSDPAALFYGCLFAIVDIRSDPQASGDNFFTTLKNAGFGDAMDNSLATALKSQELCSLVHPNSIPFGAKAISVTVACDKLLPLKKIAPRRKPAPFASS